MKTAMAMSGLCVVALSGPALAVIVTGSQGRNLTAPTGQYADSGWEIQGDFRGELATPIAGNWAITATHIGSALTDTVTTLDGTVHPVTKIVKISGTDLTLLQTSVPYASYASIYNPATDDPISLTHDEIIVYGRGTARGDAIDGHGWAWGAEDHLRSWGTDTLDSIDTISGAKFLTAHFDGTNGNANQGTLSTDDSGGGVFVFKNGAWKLVGINNSVDRYALTATGAVANAAIDQAQGMYENGTEITASRFQKWYASYVPASLATINATVPEPSALAAVAAAGVLLGRRRRA